MVSVELFLDASQHCSLPSSQTDMGHNPIILLRIRIQSRVPLNMKEMDGQLMRLMEVTFARGCAGTQGELVLSCSQQVRRRKDAHLHYRSLVFLPCTQIDSCALLLAAPSCANA